MKELIGTELAKRVKSGETIGVGTGSTVDAALIAIGRRIKDEGLELKVVPTSYQSAWRCAELGMVVLSPIAAGILDWGFDGADAVNQKLEAIKGKGGAMLREKILACRCKKYVLIADQTKLVRNIAEKSPIPIEVIPEALDLVLRSLKTLGATDTPVRQAVAKHGPVITELGNLIVDATFTEIQQNLEKEINCLVGVVENGLFTSYATELLIGSSEGIQAITRD